MLNHTYTATPFGVRVDHCTPAGEVVYTEYLANSRAGTDADWFPTRLPARLKAGVVMLVSAFVGLIGGALLV